MNREEAVKLINDKSILKGERVMYKGEYWTLEEIRVVGELSDYNNQVMVIISNPPKSDAMVYLDFPEDFGFHFGV